MFGVSGTKGDTGFPWMLASDALSSIRKSFLRESKDYVERMHEDYPKLTNFAWSKNTVHLQWLQWLGFFFLEPESYGESGELFIRFYKVKKNV